jgi:hypothetical protein
VVAAITTPASVLMSRPVAWTILGIGLLGAAFLVISALIDRLHQNRLAAAANQEPSVTEQNDQPHTVVQSFNQQGGVTTGTYINNGPPPPTFDPRPVAENDRRSDGYHTILVGTVTSQFPAHRLEVVARAPSIRKVSLRPIDMFAIMNVLERSGEGVAAAGFDSPRGRVEIDIVTAAPEQQIELGWEFPGS